MQQIYLDNQATTPVDPKVLSAMNPWFSEKFGNASSRNHIFGWEAEEAIEIARESLSQLINAVPKEIIFTSGATESNNIAIQGVAYKCRGNKKHIITLKTEHRAVLDICRHLGKNQFDITYLSVDKEGLINLSEFENAIRKETILVSIMHVNNEIGVIQPIKKIGEICNQNNIIFHVDAAQSIGKIPVNVNEMNIDLLSISAHKFYGPKGIGALYIRRKNPEINIQPIVFGGGHERGMRSGTLPVPSIVGLGKASEIAKEVMDLEKNQISELNDYLLKGILSIMPTAKVNGSMKYRIPGNLNINFCGINNEILIAAMPGIAISTGSACSGSTIKASHVLASLGLTKDEIFSSIRFGIGRFNNKNHIFKAVENIDASVKKIKGHSIN